MTGGQRFYVDDLQACAPESLSRVDGIDVTFHGLDSMGFDRVAIEGPSTAAVAEYVRENWGADDFEWFREWVLDRIRPVEVVVRLTADDAVALAEAAEFLAGVDEGENTDYDNLLRLAKLVREQAGEKVTS